MQFLPVPDQVRFPALEEEILARWEAAKIYEQSLARRAGAKRFVFYEGPPTANGLPHPGHCLTRAIKDLFPRYQTMRGKLCERKAGWDTHGLPVEVEVCKELGIHSKDEIESFGVEPFIHRCQESVFRYTKEWERLTKRLGFWVNLDDAYVTYHQSYIESVWWALKNLFDRGLLYQGHKIVWWWAQGGTALSSGEVGQGYREVADPSVYVRFPLLDESGRASDTDLLVWTTTPWTLPSNQFAAVHPDLEYAVVSAEGDDRKLVLAAALMETIAGKVKKELRVERTFPGSELVGRRYVPPFDYYRRTQGDVQGLLAGGGRQHVAWRVIAAAFVTTDSGTGAVHQAPAFGEVDYEVLAQERNRFAPGSGPELICAVAPDGNFTSEAPDYQGRWVKDCDKDITRSLRDRGLLFHQEQYLHDYPFCWRAEEDPLIQYPRKSWFIKTTAFKDAMLANNAEIGWRPEHIKAGRFGNFLESNVDWALSRERYWGTPLPIWVCGQTGQMEAVGSYAELLAKPGVRGAEAWQRAKEANPGISEHLVVHKPYIDEMAYDSPFAAGARMHRVPEVIDCWFDSGAMPFAQWGYPQHNQEKFTEQFPAHFISEALDQTRGWFYSLLAISTLLLEGKAKPHPFRNCIVLGLMLGEDGGKMSKSKRNYREPAEIFDRYGADALRWYFFANQPPWTSIRYSEAAIKDSIPEFLLRLWNVYSFFVIYANIDGFDPVQAILDSGGRIEQLGPDELAAAKTFRDYRQRSELDRWILSELDGAIAAVIERMENYDNYAAAAAITAFVDALSNWYVRRSRDRFWAADKHSPDKLDAYWTLYECLLSISKVAAPFVPFLTDAMWQNLAVAASGGAALASVHLCDFPNEPEVIADDNIRMMRTGATDYALAGNMRLVREIVSVGRSARSTAKLKVRQPLAKVEVILGDKSMYSRLERYRELIAEELNVKEVEFTMDAEKYVTYTVLPDLKRLGPKLGRQLPAVKAALASMDGAAVKRQLDTNYEIRLSLPDGEVTLLDVDLQIRFEGKPGWAAAYGSRCAVVLSTELTPALLVEGLAREIVHAIQGRRKDLQCQYTDRIDVAIVTQDADVWAALDQFGEYIQNETLATRLTNKPLEACEPVEVKVGPATFQLYLRVGGLP